MFIILYIILCINEQKVQITYFSSFFFKHPKNTSRRDPPSPQNTDRQKKLTWKKIRLSILCKSTFLKLKIVFLETLFKIKLLIHLMAAEGGF